MLVKSVISAIEQIADPSWQAVWDKSGLQVASTRTEIGHICVCLDPLPASLEKALQSGADFILSHHPLSLKPELPNRDDNYYKALALLLRANVPLYAAHTSLDVNLAGPAGWLARVLELTDVMPLEQIGNDNLGFGFSGLLPAPLPLPELIGSILSLLRLDCAALTGPETSAPVYKVAACGGSGASLAGLAYNSGAGLYITGDIKYHAALEARLPIVDVGHHSLEEEMMRGFAQDLSRLLPEVKIEFLSSRSPFRMAFR